MSFHRSVHHDHSFQGFDLDEIDDSFASEIRGFADRTEQEDDGRGNENNKSLSPLPYSVTAFPDGVSSGDVTQTSAVLWARANKRGVVTFQISSDPDFHHVIGSRAVSVADSLIPAKVLIDGLHSDQRYYYRAVDADEHIAEGTFETAPKLGQHKGFTFGAAGDTRGELAPYPSIKNAPTAGLDVFIM